MHGERRARRANGVVALDDATDARERLGARALAHEQPSTLIHEREGDHTQDHPDDHRGGRIEKGRVVAVPEIDAAEGDDEASESRAILIEGRVDGRILTAMEPRPEGAWTAPPQQLSDR